MQHADETGQLRRVKEFAKRRCPHCGSDKWEWLGAVPTTPEELAEHLLVRYRCRKCKNEFLAEEARGARLVESTTICVFCKSDKIEKTSVPGADLEIWRCRRCNGYMGINPPPETGIIIVEEGKNS
jgi:hypothetical protein